MESLIGYTSEDEAGDYEDMKNGTKRSGSQLETDDNYDNVQMDMSEDSNMVQSSDASRSDSSSDEETRKRSPTRVSNDEKKPKERKESDARDAPEKKYDRQNEIKEDRKREPYERKEKREEWKERPEERKYKPEAKGGKDEDRGKKHEERKRKREDDRKERRDDSGRGRDQRSNERSSKDADRDQRSNERSSKDADRDQRSNERFSKDADRDSKIHKDKDYWERGIDDKRSKSRDKSRKETRRVEEKRPGGKTDERRLTDRKPHGEEKKDARRGEDRKDSKEKVWRDATTAKRDRSRSRSPRRPAVEEKIKKTRSRSPSSHHSTKSRSPLVSDKKSTGEKRGSSPRRGDQKRSKHSPDHRRRSRSRDRHSPEPRRRSRSRDRSPQRSRPYEKKPSKLSILERLGISLPSVSDMTGVITPQELVQRSMQAQVQQVKSKTGIELPSYYNPAAMNPARYAEQIQKRRLLWGNKGNELQDKKVVEAPAPSATGNNWEGTTFAADQDGKMTAKFKRLMGIKNQGASGSSEGSGDGSKPEIIKKQEELFSSMEMQYEVARVATHTHRGLGLGFGTFQYPR